MIKNVTCFECKGTFEDDFWREFHWSTYDCTPSQNEWRRQWERDYYHPHLEELRKQCDEARREAYRKCKAEDTERERKTA